MFIAKQCFVSNAYNQIMAAFFEDYFEKAVTFIGINSIKQEAAEEVKAYAEENGLDFITLENPNNVNISYIDNSVHN